MLALNHAQPALRCVQNDYFLSQPSLPHSAYHMPHPLAPHQYSPTTTLYHPSLFAQGTYSLAGAGSCTSCTAVRRHIPFLGQLAARKSFALIHPYPLTIFPPLISPFSQFTSSNHRHFLPEMLPSFCFGIGRVQHCGCCQLRLYFHSVSRWHVRKLTSLMP